MTDKNLCEIDISIYDIYSPNIEQAEIVVDIYLAQLILMFEPVSMNEMIKFFRNVKSQVK